MGWNSLHALTDTNQQRQSTEGNKQVHRLGNLDLAQNRAIGVKQSLLHSNTEIYDNLSFTLQNRY